MTQLIESVITKSNSFDMKETYFKNTTMCFYVFGIRFFWGKQQTREFIRNVSFGSPLKMKPMYSDKFMNK